jgi:hypothetical protein
MNIHENSIKKLIKSLRAITSEDLNIIDLEKKSRPILSDIDNHLNDWLINCHSLNSNDLNLIEETITNLGDIFNVINHPPFLKDQFAKIRMIIVKLETNDSSLSQTRSFELFHSFLLHCPKHTINTSDIVKSITSIYSRGSIAHQLKDAEQLIVDYYEYKAKISSSAKAVKIIGKVLSEFIVKNKMITNKAKTDITEILTKIINLYKGNEPALSQKIVSFADLSVFKKGIREFIKIKKSLKKVQIDSRFIDDFMIQ